MTRYIKHLLPIIIIFSLPGIGITQAQAAVSHGPADLCTTQEYIALDYGAASQGIQCRSARAWKTLSQIRKHGQVVAYNMRVCSWREHDGTLEYVKYGNYRWKKGSGWHRFSPMHCKAVRVKA